MITENDRALLKGLAELAQHSFQTVEEEREVYERWSVSHHYNLPEIATYETGIELREGLYCDIAAPGGRGPLPVLLYLHGGAFRVGSPLTHRKLAMQLAELGYVVVNLGYRLAPEHPYPAGLEDCIFAANWIAAHAHRWGGDASRLVVAGDSVGGGLTAATLLALGDGRGPPAAAGVLIYGVYDLLTFLQDTGGAEESLAITYLGENYRALAKYPSVSPLYGVASGTLPPCLIIIGGEDRAFMPQAEAMAKALAAAGVRHRLEVYEGMPHAFMQMGELTACRQALKDIGAFLEEHLPAVVPAPDEMQMG
ncbi:MAG: alpha/beta hydrolase [Rhizobiaceae bacterium]